MNFQENIQQMNFMNSIDFFKTQHQQQKIPLQTLNDFGNYSTNLLIPTNSTSSSSIESENNKENQSF